MYDVQQRKQKSCKTTRQKNPSSSYRNKKNISQVFTPTRVFRFSGFKKEIAKHFFCSFVHFKLLYEFQSWFTSLYYRVGTHLLMTNPLENNIL